MPTIRINHRLIIAFADPSKNTITAETKEICGIKLQRPHDTVIDPATGWIYALNPNSGHIFRFTAIGENESVIKAPTQGYARALTFANGKLYAIGSSKGRIVEVVDWEKPTFKVYDSFDPTNRQGGWLMENNRTGSQRCGVFQRPLVCHQLLHQILCQGDRL